MITLSIIIVLYNEFDKVKQCIASIKKEHILNSELLLVDNSTERGVNKVLQLYSDIKYIKNKTNLGFAKGVNIGFAKARGKYILVLTPDTQVLPETIKNTLAYIKIHEKAGLVGFRIYSYPKVFHPSAFHSFPNLLTHVYEYNIPFYKLYKLFSKNYHPAFYSANDHKKELSPKHIIGAYMLFRKSALDDVGFFDKQFILFREETDLCKRLMNNGWEIRYIPIDGLVHYGGAAWKKTTISQALPNYMQSTYLFFKKHYGAMYMIIAWIIGFMSALISIPFLFITIIFKKLIHKQTQARILLPAWIAIVKWHMTKGIQQIFFNTI